MSSTALQDAPDTQDQPDWSAGIGLAIDMIESDLREDLPTLLRHLATAQRAKNPVAVKLSAEKLSKFLGGMQGVADSIVRSSLRHINRRPRP